MAFKDELGLKAFVLRQRHDALDAVGEDVDRAMYSEAAVFDAVDDRREFGGVVRLFARHCAALSRLSSEVIVEVKSPTCAAELE